MKIRIINNQKVWQGDAIPTRIADRPNMTHYEQRTDLHEADGFYDAVLMDIPAGSRLVSETWTIVDHKAVQGGVVETAEQMEARRIAGLVELYGETVGRLATFLDVFALKMPITKQAAITKIYGDSKADGKKNPDAMMLMSIYDELIGVMSNDDIYAVGKAIGVAV